MPAFQYAALDAKGRIQTGLLEGDTARHVRQLLRERALIPLEVEAVASGEAVVAERPGLPRRATRVSAAELALLTRQLATLVGAGLPLEQALSALAEQTLDKVRLRRLLLALRSRVLEGQSLAAALGRFPRAFPELYRATVAAGEQSGHLDIVLERLADYTESRQLLRQKTALALLYPLLLTLVAFAIVIGLLAFVVPQVTQVFVSMNRPLPGLTQGLISVSQFVREHAAMLAVGSAVVAAGVGYAVVKTRLGYVMQRLWLALPLLGRLIRDLNGARFARTFSILLASSVPVLEALRISAQVVANRPMQETVQRAAQQVKEGASLHRALSAGGYFSPLLLQLIASGEASGRLESMLERAAIQQERETRALIDGLLGVFEPLLILLMGGVVLLIVLAILLPIFDLNQMIG